MKLKILYMVVLFQIAGFHTWSQSNDDILQRGKPKPKSGEITLSVDTDIRQGKTPEEQERAKQDSIRQVNGRWERILSEKNIAMRQLLDSILQMNGSKPAKERIEEYKLKVNSLNRQIENKIQNDGLWKNNDRLDDMYNRFLDDYEMALLKLQQRAEKTKYPWEGLKINWLYVFGGGVVAFIVSFPMIMQRRAKRAMKKLISKQDREAKKRAEEEEIRRLLAKEDDIVT